MAAVLAIEAKTMASMLFAFFIISDDFKDLDKLRKVIGGMFTKID